MLHFVKLPCPSSFKHIDQFRQFMPNAITMKSGEDAPMPAAMSGAEEVAVAPEPTTVREAAPVVVLVAPEPAAMREVEPEEAPQPAPLMEAAAEEAPQEGAEASAPADGDDKTPVSPSKVTERQIPVDPASLRRLGTVADEDAPLSAPSVLTEVVVQSPLLPPLRRPTFVGASLPCSAVNSPVHSAGRGAGAKCEENAATANPSASLSSSARQHSAALARLVAAPAAVAPLALSRSASRAEGRTMVPHHDDEPVDLKDLAADDSFTCGALCMLIPGFSKKKPASAASAAGMAMSNMQRQQSGARPRRSSASRVASLERFECGSWSPPPPPPPPVAAAAAVAARDSDCHAQEVPKISCADDTESPVKMAFVFDGEVPTRGILKNSASSRLSSARPSTSSQRHVRFSTAAAEAASCPSSPTSVVTPRLARARAEFNAFLEAQSA